MNLNSILIGTDDPARLTDYYTKVFGPPAMNEGGYVAWRVGNGSFVVGAHDQVRGKNKQPGRLIWNIESGNVVGDFERLRAAGAIVVRDPYGMGEGDGKIATFADPDDNYFQLVSAME